MRCAERNGLADKSGVLWVAKGVTNNALFVVPFKAL
jgi:hypothetical protein